MWNFLSATQVMVHKQKRKETIEGVALSRELAKRAYWMEWMEMEEQSNKRDHGENTAS
jgi:hypothetical protein